MAQKNNIRSIRFSDELAELIDRQVGRTFTEKFENLVTRCVWELPEKEKELERLSHTALGQSSGEGGLAGARNAEIDVEDIGRGGRSQPAKEDE